MFSFIKTKTNYIYVLIHFRHIALILVIYVRISYLGKIKVVGSKVNEILYNCVIGESIFHVIRPIFS